MDRLLKTLGSAVTGGAIGAIGSAVGSVTNGITSLTSEPTSRIGGLPSAFGDSLEVFGKIDSGITRTIGGVIGNTAEILSPQEFFQDLAQGAGHLAGDLLPATLGSIGNVLAEPALNFGNAIGGFAENVFGGDLVGSLENGISDVPVLRLPFDLLQNSFEKNVLSISGIFDQLKTFDPVAPDYHSQFLSIRVQIGQLSQADITINRIMGRMKDFTERLIRGDFDKTKKEIFDEEREKERDHERIRQQQRDFFK